ncbi:AraC family transcriptional regulator [Chryseolinea soli]|uniref:AraC family transcriptional regulator n=2 Tax=Chryseolinea soli TaxID=2321403 RepID=A0A385SNW4_9BACT|nr:AraC family transcriptional regulator [Chryseolinea soli]
MHTLITMPYRIDLFAVFIFLGIVQGIFLSLFFLSKENRQIQANLFHGMLLLAMVGCTLEIFLMYTGYIVHCLFLVDFSEPLGMAIGPLFYLLVLSYIHGGISKKQYGHLVFPVVYVFLELPFLLQPDDVKYNAYIWAYHPELPLRDVTAVYDARMFWVTDHATETILISLALYGILSVIAVTRAFRQKKESFWKPAHPVLRSLREPIVQMITASVIVLAVKLTNVADTGDHLFAVYVSIVIYFTSFRVIRRSGFFKHASLAEAPKYKSSSLSPDLQNALVEKLKLLMAEQKPFLQADFSLPELAHQLGSTVHIVSQVINERLGKNFFEMAAEYRVEEAKRLLREQPNIKVEEIAEQVGYSSKSSFNTVFKKYTGTTPSRFRAEKS